jgi:chitodextrinase
MSHLRKRCSLAAGVAALALLALPALAAANPGTGPELVQRSGRLVAVHTDRLDGSSSQRWVLENGLHQLPVRMPAGVWVDPGSSVRLEGTLQDGALVLADSLSAVDQLAPAPSALAPDTTAAAPSLHMTAIILFGFSGGPSYTALPPAAQPASAAQALAFGSDPSSLDSYYLEQTYGQLGFTGQTFGPFNVMDTESTCTGTDLSRWAEKAEASAGINETASPYQHYVFVFPFRSSCTFAGIAEIGGHHVWINGDYSVRVLAHELGHNLGLAHAGGLACTDAGVAAPMGDSCTADGFEYLDPFDAMGSGDVGSGQSLVRQMSMEHKLALHLLPTSAVKVIGTSGTYRIAPMETLTGTPELLRIPKFGGGNYFVEYRQPIGFFDSLGPPFANGVLIRTESPDVASNPSHPNADTALIDMHPETQDDWTDAAMDPGQVFNDRLHGISIRNVGQDASGVTLAITVPGDTLPPSAPSGLAAVADGTTAQLRWNAATDDFSVDDYVVKRDGAQVGTPVATSFTDTGLVPGTTVSYTVAAVDAGGNIGPAAAVSLAIPDTTAPGAPAKVTAKVTKKGQVQLAWGAATDNGRVASYRIRRAGRQIATATGRTFLDKSPKPGSGSTVTYSVVAVDAAGNAGPAGKARPVRAALLRKLVISRLRIAGVALGPQALVTVTGTVSDVTAVCSVRVGRGAWGRCRPNAAGRFSATVRADGSNLVSISLRDQLGRVKLATLRIS